MNSSVNDNELFLSSDYHIVSRVDRKVGKHGGVVIAVRTSKHFVITDIICKTDYIASSIIDTSDTYMLLINVYNPPLSSSYRVSANQLVFDISDILNQFSLICISNGVSIERRRIILLGDFNTPDICWQSYHSSSVDSTLFLDAIDTWNLMQIIDKPTHIHGNIDLVFVCDDHNITTNVLNERLSDHFPIILEIAVSLPSKDCTTAITTFSKRSFNYTAFMYNVDALYSITSHSDFSSVSSYTFMHDFYDAFHAVISVSVSKKRFKRISLPFYYSSHTIHLSNKIDTEQKRRNRDCSVNKTRLFQLQLDFQDSVELDKVVLCNSFKSFSTNDCFKFLRSINNAHSRENVLGPTRSSDQF